MITLVLALLISYSIAQVLISSNQTSVSSDGLSQAQESGRFAMSFMAKHIRLAGLKSIIDESVNPMAFGASLNSNLADSGDRLAIRYVPTAAAAGEAIESCSGMDTGFDGRQIIEHRFWVSNNNLVCQSFNAAGISFEPNPQVIANGVEAMQVLYGYADGELEDSAGQRNVSRYINLEQIPDAAFTPGVPDWNKVYAIRIALMSRSISDFTTDERTTNHVLLDSPRYTTTDSISRQVFNSTFIIENFF